MDRVNVRWNRGRRFVGVDSSGHGVVMDATAENGGEGSGVRPLELVLYALGGCTGIDVLSILEKKRQRVTDFEVYLDAEKRDEIPRLYSDITIRYLITGHGIKSTAVEHAIGLSEEKYCSVRAMLGPDVRVTSSYEIREAE